jgi:signal transduction histidine kinase/ligand-binding sensor domain-containing protein
VAFKLPGLVLYSTFGRGLPIGLCRLRSILTATLAIRGLWQNLLVLLACFQLANVPLRASLDPSKALTQYAKQVWKSDSGLPQGSVLALAQTADGYLWLGTEEGLVRFDGVQFTVFDKGNSAGLRSATVISLLVDHEDRLWVGTHGGGLTRFTHGKFESGLLGHGLDSQSVQCLYEDHKGAVWIGTSSGGLVRYFNGETRVYTTADGLSDNTVLSLSGDKDGALWIGTNDGLSRFSDGRFSVVRGENGASFGSVRATYVGRQGVIWIGTNPGGLFRIGTDGITRFTTKEGLTSNAVQTIYEDNAQTLWVGTQGGGLDRIVRGHITSLTKNDGLNGFAVVSIFEDREGNLWLGCIDGGVTRLRDGAVTTISKQEGLLADSILPVYQDKDGSVWIGTLQGLNRWKDGQLSSYTMADGLPDKPIFSIAQTSDGVLWVGTHNGLARMTGNRFALQAGAPHSPVMCLYADPTDGLWICGRGGGLTHFDGERFVTYTTKDGLSSNFVTAVHRSSNGTLWIGTDGGGMNSYRDGKFKTHPILNGSVGNVVYGLTSDPDGTLWIATRGDGLGRLRGGKFTMYSSLQGLPADSIFGVIDDKLGHLWMTSNKGIFSVEKMQLEQLDAGIVKKITAALYGVSDGMKNKECDGGFQPAVWRTLDGRLWFPTTEGVSIVDPAHLRKSSVPLVVMVQQMFADGKEQAIDRQIVVSPGEGRLAFHFTAPTFIDPYKVQFRYQLEQFDKDWRQEDNSRTAVYTNIPPGKYRFRVRASRDGQKWYGDETALAFTLQPHYYQRFEFSALMAMVVTGLVLAVHRMRIRHLRENESKLLQLVEKRTAELRQSRDELEVRVAERTQDLRNSNLLMEAEVVVRTMAEQKAETASQAKTQFLTNMSHEIRTPINGIVGMTDLTLATEVTEEQREYLEIVRASADSLLLIVNDIMDFSQMESSELTLEVKPFRVSGIFNDLEKTLGLRARQKNLTFHLRINPGMPDYFSGDPLRVRQVLLNLLDNGIKFTDKGSVSLNVGIDEVSGATVVLHFSVTDTGIGVPADKCKSIFEAFSQADITNTRRFGGTGLGLTISSRLASMMDGRLWVDSTVGVGSTFHFTARFGLAPESMPAQSSSRKATAVSSL